MSLHRHRTVLYAAVVLVLATTRTWGGCVEPATVDFFPTMLGVSTTDCSEPANLTLDLDGTGPFDLTWSVIAPPGGSAFPPFGTVASDVNSISFSSTLIGTGNFTVTALVTNACGSVGDSFVVTVEDRLGPDIVVDAFLMECSRLLARPPGLGLPTGETSLNGPARVDHGPRQHGLEADGEGEIADLDYLEEKRRVDAREAELAEERLSELDPPDIPMALGCGSPCTTGTAEAIHPFYDVFINCNDGSFTARTGALHPVTVSSGAMQNVIFGGAGGGSTTSDAGWYIHDTGTFFNDPMGAAVCVFDPPDTAAEPNSIGLEAEWTVSPADGINLVLREEMVAFGTTPENSGIRMSLGIANDPGSMRTISAGVRWQIDYQNASDDGPIFASVSCQPPEVVEQWTTEHLLTPAETLDFYRIQNNTGTPIFGNFNSTTELVGFPGTGTPDRLVYGRWSALRGSAWNYVVAEGAAGPDSDSAVLFSYGHELANAMTIAPGESFLRSVVLFTSDDAVDCGDFTPGTGTGTFIQACPGDCVEIGALALDACGTTTANLVGTSPGAPPCVGLPCEVQFIAPGEYTYTFAATDEAGNMTEAEAVVRILTDIECSAIECRPAVSGPPPDVTICEAGLATLDARSLSLLGCATEITYEWRDGSGMVVGTDPVIDVAPTATTTYTVTVDCMGVADCAYEDTATVLVELPPVFDTVDAIDISPCNIGVDLQWWPATFRSDAGTGAYNIYRSTVSCDDALLQPPLKTGYPFLQLFDDDVDGSGTYYYVIEAEDSQRSTCTPQGVHYGGLATRLCLEAVMDAESPGTPNEVFNTLRASNVGEQVTMSWVAARPLLPTESYVLFKALGSPTAIFQQVNPAGDVARSFDDLDTSSPIQFFDLRVQNQCGDLSIDEYPPGYDH
ncbi:MAG: hypothetical protein AAF533_13495 [Acidobacteriota bacterium]